MAGNKKTITVTLRVKELVFDIQNKAYLTGLAREAEGKKGYEATSIMQASDDVENSYQIRRSLTDAFAILKSVLGEYLTENNTTSDNVINNEIDNGGTLTLSFVLPSNYNNASNDSISKNIHAYLVDIALRDWFAITNKEDADTYTAHAAVSLENVKRDIYKRSRPTRRIYTNEKNV